MRNNSEKYIEIRFAGTSESGITNVWEVRNTRTNEMCGEIRWHGAFRSYCFFPPDGFLYDAGCLRIIMEFLENQAAMRQAIQKAKREAKRNES